MAGWVLATDVRRTGAMVSALRGLGGDVTVLAVGPRSVADAAAAGPDAVRWIETTGDSPAEAYAPAVRRVMSAAGPRAVLAAATPEGRALLGAAAVALGAVVVPGVLRMSVDGDTVVAERADLGGRVVETLASAAPVAGLFGGGDAPRSAAQPAPVPVERLDAGDPADVRVEKTEPVSGVSTGVTSAERIVAVGRGLRAKADLALAERLAAALKAEIGCSMPLADDFGWVAKERYIGRSGQHVSPRLYLAIGISGAPQHVDGLHDAKVVVAVNADPGARIFRRAGYGIVGDLYAVVPAITAALEEEPNEGVSTP